MDPNLRGAKSLVSARAAGILMMFLGMRKNGSLNSGGTACLYPRGVDFTIILTQSSAPPLDAGVNWRFQFSKVSKLESSLSPHGLCDPGHVGMVDILAGQNLERYISWLDCLLIFAPK
jgi:hypothetical protein